MPKNKVRQKKPGHNKRIEAKIRMAQNLNPFIQKHIERLTAENEMMKTNPDTVVGQVIGQLRDAIGQNKRLSVLAAALIEAQGGSVLIQKAALTAFETKILNIKWELPEGIEKPDDAESFIFTFEAKDAPKPEDAPVQPQVTVTPVDETAPAASVEIESVSETPVNNEAEVTELYTGVTEAETEEEAVS